MTNTEVIKLIADKIDMSISEILVPKNEHKLMLTLLESLEVAQDYARLQIEKDRERVKKNVSLLWSCDGKAAMVDPKSIDETPIQLD